MIDQAERRKDVRVVFHTTSVLKFPKKEFKDCGTRDLSVAGAYIVGVTGPKIGDTCEVSLHLAGNASQLLLKLKGEVVRVAKDGVGLQFFDVDNDCFCHLTNIVYYNYKHPDEVKAQQTEKGTDYFKKPKTYQPTLNIVDDEQVYMDNDEFDEEEWKTVSSKTQDLEDMEESE
ncbi:MAG: PilZ domain-containing protein [Proteobacteria bacterium]|nr:PilZ domain-containing protein [Pseudomonadota bacterium]MBU1708767.1 PilZ domain-containing protein [Pseudomonadota bacterium]